jgi:hypothetical protein
MDSDLIRIAGADVLLIFVESYGAVSYDRPEFATQLATARQRLDADIHATGRDVVSAYVESPTFGGGSWFAHISLLSGIDTSGVPGPAGALTVHALDPKPAATSITAMSVPLFIRETCARHSRSDAAS